MLVAIAVSVSRVTKRGLPSQFFYLFLLVVLFAALEIVLSNKTIS